MSNKITVRVCHGMTCKHRADAILKAAQKKEGADVTVEKSPCMGQCKKGPNIQIVKDGKRTTKNYMSPTGTEKEIDIAMGKAQPARKVGGAKSAVNNLLSGGF